ncbi:DUF4266 domain-containing protein [Fulvivirgaceae bacterium BMA12]|uniref:DUF4266 domain-containing protein n=1 Tax=Agaribacillus aureus TaxID=3051825 RepID=A0ABT8L223_9BACT|nr:DUF4266 domain-containing protein [Fulvivirgaceae bacterium BMA12]
MNNIKLLLIFAFIFFSCLIQGCVSVEAYQKMYLNDEEMELSSRKVEYFEINIESYREGASGINGGKVGGGCGCN